MSMKSGLGVVASYELMSALLTSPSPDSGVTLAHHRPRF
jgi:hypothetical protein